MESRTIRLNEAELTIIRDRIAAGTSPVAVNLQRKIGDALFSINQPPKPDQVEEIYAAYPRKVARPAALKAIRKALKTILPGKLLALTKQYATVCSGDEFTPYPATWFNQERFNDDPATWKRNCTGPGDGKAQSIGSRFGVGG
jgi:hypothetical protein